MTGEPKLLKKVVRAELLCVKGVGPEYADLLQASGVESLKDLSTRTPAQLHARMIEVNNAKKLVGRPPAASQVASWIANAKAFSLAADHDSVPKRQTLVEYLLSAPQGEPEIPLDRGVNVPA
jgi:predicted flap endonuclease-1-like 5' DNA nuclease